MSGFVNISEEETGLAILIQNAKNFSPYRLNFPKKRGPFSSVKSIFWRTTQELEDILKEAYDHSKKTSIFRFGFRNRKRGNGTIKLALNVIKRITSYSEVDISDSLSSLLGNLLTYYNSLMAEIKEKKTDFRNKLSFLLDILDTDGRYYLISRMLLSTIGNLIWKEDEKDEDNEGDNEDENLELELPLYALINNLVYLSYIKPPEKFFEIVSGVMKELRQSSRDYLYNKMIFLNNRLIEEVSRKNLSKERFYMEYLKHLGNRNKPLILSLKEYFMLSNSEILAKYLKGKVMDAGFNTRNASEKTERGIIALAMNNSMELGILITIYVALKRFLSEYTGKSEIGIYEDYFLYLLNMLSKRIIPSVNISYPLQYLNQKNPSISSGFKILPKTLFYILSSSRYTNEEYSKEIHRRGEITILTFFQDIYAYYVLLRKRENKYLLCLREEKICPKKATNTTICYDITPFLRGFSKIYSERTKPGVFLKFILSLGAHLPSISQYIEGLKRFLDTLEEIIDSMIFFDIRKYRRIMSNEKTKGIFGEMEEFLGTWGDYFYERYILDVWR